MYTQESSRVIHGGSPISSNINNNTSSNNTNNGASSSNGVTSSASPFGAAFSTASLTALAGQGPMSPAPGARTATGGTNGGDAGSTTANILSSLTIGRSDPNKRLSYAMFPTSSNSNNNANNVGGTGGGTGASISGPAWTLPGQTRATGPAAGAALSMEQIQAHILKMQQQEAALAVLTAKPSANNTSNVGGNAATASAGPGGGGAAVTGMPSTPPSAGASVSVNMVSNSSSAAAGGNREPLGAFRGGGGSRGMGTFSTMSGIPMMSGPGQPLPNAGQPPSQQQQRQQRPVIGGMGGLSVSSMFPLPSGGSYAGRGGGGPSRSNSGFSMMPSAPGSVKPFQQVQNQNQNAQPPPLPIPQPASSRFASLNRGSGGGGGNNSGSAPGDSPHPAHSSSSLQASLQGGQGSLTTGNIISSNSTNASNNKGGSIQSPFGFGNHMMHHQGQPSPLIPLIPQQQQQQLQPQRGGAGGGGFGQVNVSSTPSSSSLPNAASMTGPSASLASVGMPAVNMKTNATGADATADSTDVRQLLAQYHSLVKQQQEIQQQLEERLMMHGRQGAGGADGGAGTGAGGIPSSTPSAVTVPSPANVSPSAGTANPLNAFGPRTPGGGSGGGLAVSSVGGQATPGQGGIGSATMLASNSSLSNGINSSNKGGGPARVGGRGGYCGSGNGGGGGFAEMAVPTPASQRLPQPRCAVDSAVRCDGPFPARGPLSMVPTPASGKAPGGAGATAGGTGFAASPPKSVAAAAQGQTAGQLDLGNALMRGVGSANSNHSSGANHNGGGGRWGDGFEADPNSAGPNARDGSGGVPQALVGLPNTSNSDHRSSTTNTNNTSNIASGGLVIPNARSMSTAQLTSQQLQTQRQLADLFSAINRAGVDADNTPKPMTFGDTRPTSHNVTTTIAANREALTVSKEAQARGPDQAAERGNTDCSSTDGSRAKPTAAPMSTSTERASTPAKDPTAATTTTTTATANTTTAGSTDSNSGGRDAATRLPGPQSPLFFAKTENTAATNAWRTGGGGRQLFRQGKDGESGSANGNTGTRSPAAISAAALAGAGPLSNSVVAGGPDSAGGNASSVTAGSMEARSPFSSPAIPQPRHHGQQQEQQQPLSVNASAVPELSAAATAGRGSPMTPSDSNTETLTPLQRMQRQLQQRRQAELEQHQQQQQPTLQPGRGGPVPLPAPARVMAAAAATPVDGNVSKTPIEMLLDMQRRIQEQRRMADSQAPPPPPQQQLQQLQQQLHQQQQQQQQQPFSSAPMRGMDGGRASAGRYRGDTRIPLPASLGGNRNQEDGHGNFNHHHHHNNNSRGIAHGSHTSRLDPNGPADVHSHLRGGRGFDGRHSSGSSNALPAVGPPDAAAVSHFRQLYSHQEDEEAVGAQLREQLRSTHGTTGTLDVPACMKIIEDNDITFVVTDTGTGKSTLIPKAIFDTAKAVDTRVNVVNCQPRRTSAINLAQRVAKLMGEERPGTSVGYSVRGERAGELGVTELMYVTNYTLFLHIMWRAPGDIPFTHIILDEFHERTSEVEMLLPMLKLVLQRHPGRFKLILCSATAQVEEWSNFFDGFTMGTYSQANEMYPVHKFCLQDVCKLTGKAFFPYEVRPDNIVESLQLQNIIGTVKLLLQFLAGVATPSHSILVFLPGRTTVEQMADWIRANFKDQLDPIPWYRDIDLSHIQSALDREAITRKKVYLATDIAEVSLTLPDVVFVIDSGMGKRPLITAQNPGSIMFPPLHLLWESAMNAQQRRGRIGRVQQGFCFCLLSAEHYASLERAQSRIKNSVMNELVMHTLQLAPNPLASFTLCREQPRLVSVFHSLMTLRDAGLILPSSDTMAAAEALRFKNQTAEAVVAAEQWAALIRDAVKGADMRTFVGPGDLQPATASASARPGATPPDLSASAGKDGAAERGDLIAIPPALADDGRQLITLQELSSFIYHPTMKGMFVSHLPVDIDCATGVFLGLQFGLPNLAIIAAAVEATKTPFYIPYDVVSKSEKRASYLEVSAEMTKYRGELNSDVVSCVGVVLSYMDMQRQGLSEEAQEEWCVSRYVSRSRLVDILNLIEQITEQTRAILPFPEVKDIDQLVAQYEKKADLLAFLSVAAHMPRAMYVNYDEEQSRRKGYCSTGIFTHMQCVKDVFVPTVCPWKVGTVCIPLSLQTTYNKLRAAFATQVSSQMFNLAMLIFSFRIGFMKKSVPTSGRSNVPAPASAATAAAVPLSRPEEQVYLFQARYMNLLQTFQCDELTGKQILQLRRIQCARLCAMQTVVEGEVAADNVREIGAVLRRTPTDFGIPDAFYDRCDVIPSLLQTALSSLLARVNAGITSGAIHEESQKPPAVCPNPVSFGYCFVVPHAVLTGAHAGESLLVHAHNGILPLAGTSGFGAATAARSAPSTTNAPAGANGGATTAAAANGSAALSSAPSARVPPPIAEAAVGGPLSHEDGSDAIGALGAGSVGHIGARRHHGDDGESGGYHSDSSDSMNHVAQFHFDV